MTNQEELQQVHPFSMEGLGEPPFTIVGMKVVAAGSELCDYCGRSRNTKYFALFESSDGLSFQVARRCSEAALSGSTIREEVHDRFQKVERRDRNAREDRRIERAEKHLLNGSVRERLRRYPHPSKRDEVRGRTMLDYVEEELRERGRRRRFDAAEIVEMAADKAVRCFREAPRPVEPIELAEPTVPDEPRPEVRKKDGRGGSVKSVMAAERAALTGDVATVVDELRSAGLSGLADLVDDERTGGDGDVADVPEEEREIPSYADYPTSFERKFGTTFVRSDVSSRGRLNRIVLATKTSHKPFVMASVSPRRARKLAAALVEAADFVDNAPETQLRRRLEDHGFGNVVSVEEVENTFGWLSPDAPDLERWYEARKRCGLPTRPPRFRTGAWIYNPITGKNCRLTAVRWNRNVRCWHYLVHGFGSFDAVGPVGDEWVMTIDDGRRRYYTVATFSQRPSDLLVRRIEEVVGGKVPLFRYPEVHSRLVEVLKSPDVVDATDQDGTDPPPLQLSSEQTRPEHKTCQQWLNELLEAEGSMTPLTALRYLRRPEWAGENAPSRATVYQVLKHCDEFVGGYVHGRLRYELAERP